MNMTLHEERERVQRAVAHSLQGVQADPWLTQRVLADAKGEKRMTKKRFVLMLAASALLILSVTGALAATLGWGIIDFVGRYAGAYVPPNYEDVIQKENVTVEGDRVVCTVQESYYDGKILRVTARVVSKDGALLLEGLSP